MKKIILLFSAAVLIFSATVFAQTPDQNTVTNNKHGKAVSAAAKQYHLEVTQLKSEWKSLTPEQRKARKEEFQNRRAALKAKASNLTPEQRAAMKEKMQERRKAQQGQTTRPAKPNRPVRPNGKV